ncbi:MAG: hypothetical protein IGS48_08570, partial [Oscillatoriales cyanobacterium C42_A2020_001]|nr:hypothetical protein [Leptolyngbyaceae cyanobacterium C42_A2020_001]
MKLNSQLKIFLVTFGCVLLWQVIWGMIGSQVSRFLAFWLHALKVFPTPIIYLIISLLPLVVMYEVIAKLMFMWAIPSKLVYEPVQLEMLPHVSLNTLNDYTQRLESLGFRHL